MKDIFKELERGWHVEAGTWRRKGGNYVISQTAHTHESRGWNVVSTSIFANILRTFTLWHTRQQKRWIIIMLVPLKLLVVHLAVNHRYFYTPCRSSNILFLMPSGSVSQGTYEKKFYVLVQLACPTKTVYSRSDIWSLFNQSQSHNFSQKATSAQDKACRPVLT